MHVPCRENASCRNGLFLVLGFLRLYLTGRFLWISSRNQGKAITKKKLSQIFLLSPFSSSFLSKMELVELLMELANRISFAILWKARVWSGCVGHTWRELVRGRQTTARLQGACSGRLIKLDWWLTRGLRAVVRFCFEEMKGTFKSMWAKYFLSLL